jgi:hypothetical protein
VRSKLLNLMTKRQSVGLIGARRELATLIAQQRSAEALCARLDALLETRRQQAGNTMNVAQLREHRRMSDQLAIEAERNRARAQALAAQVSTALEDLARADHKKRTLEEATLAARLGEQAERERKSGN